MVAAPETHRPDVVVLLQGGGAKGAYQVGVLDALVEAGLEPTWILGISSGALNGVAMAGNAPADRAAALDRLWSLLADPYDVTDRLGEGLPPFFRQAMKTATSMAALAGKANFFEPSVVPFLMKPDGSVGSDSFYSSKPLYATIDAVADLDRVNAPGGIRLSVGAADVRRGVLRWFDSGSEAITADHVVASGAMPPGAPGVRIDGEMYWEGGLVGCNPLDPVVAELLAGTLGAHGALVVVVDLWGQDGWVPRNLPFSLIRRDQIHFTGRVEAALRDLRQRLTLAALDGGGEWGGAAPRAGARTSVLHIENGRTGDLLWLDPVDFSRRAIRERRAAGRRDLAAALAASDWASETSRGGPVGRIHRFREGVRVSTSGPLVPEPPSPIRLEKTAS